MWIHVFSLVPIGRQTTEFSLLSLFHSLLLHYELVSHSLKQTGNEMMRKNEEERGRQSSSSCTISGKEHSLLFCPKRDFFYHKRMEWRGDHPCCSLPYLLSSMPPRDILHQKSMMNRNITCTNRGWHDSMMKKRKRWWWWWGRKDVGRLLICFDVCVS